MAPDENSEVLEGSGVGTRVHAMQGGPDGVGGAPRLAALMAGREQGFRSGGSTPSGHPMLVPRRASTADRVGGWLSCFLLLRTHDLGEQRLG